MTAPSIARGLESSRRLLYSLYERNFSSQESDYRLLSSNWGELSRHLKPEEVFDLQMEFGQILSAPERIAEQVELDIANYWRNPVDENRYFELLTELQLIESYQEPRPRTQPPLDKSLVEQLSQKKLQEAIRALTRKAQKRSDVMQKVFQVLR